MNCNPGVSYRGFRDQMRLALAFLGLLGMAGAWSEARANDPRAGTSGVGEISSEDLDCSAQADHLSSSYGPSHAGPPSKGGVHVSNGSGSKTEAGSAQIPTGSSSTHSTGQK